MAHEFEVAILLDARTMASDVRAALSASVPTVDAMGAGGFDIAFSGPPAAGMRHVVIADPATSGDERRERNVLRHEGRWR
jgi:hypothetical protein